MEKIFHPGNRKIQPVVPDKHKTWCLPFFKTEIASTKAIRSMNRYVEVDRHCGNFFRSWFQSSCEETFQVEVPVPEEQTGLEWLEEGGLVHWRNPVFTVVKMLFRPIDLTRKEIGIHYLTWVWSDQEIQHMIINWYLYHRFNFNRRSTRNQLTVTLVLNHRSIDVTFSFLLGHSALSWVWCVLVLYNSVLGVSLTFRNGVGRHS